jgi:uncharacterized membrane protein YkvA (DUF1232 family)
MSDTDSTKYLDLFPGWLRELGRDAEALAALLEESAMPGPAREAIAGGINYLFKSLDLIPDGIDDIGYLDDAFVLRVAAELAMREDTGDADAEKLRAIGRLANDCELLRDYLDKDYARLESYVTGLKKGSARGRTVDDILANESIRAEFLSDVRGFSKSYESPSFSREEKNLIKRSLAEPRFRRGSMPQGRAWARSALTHCVHPAGKRDESRLYRGRHATDPDDSRAGRRGRLLRVDGQPPLGAALLRRL